MEKNDHSQNYIKQPKLFVDSNAAPSRHLPPKGVSRPLREGGGVTITSEC